MIWIALKLGNSEFISLQKKLVKSALFRDEQFLNIFLVFILEVILKLDKLINDKFLQLSNIYDIFFTLDVLKLDKSKLTKEEQLLNILFIAVTDVVSKLDKSIDTKL